MNRFIITVCVLLLNAYGTTCYSAEIVTLKQYINSLQGNLNLWFTVEDLQNEHDDNSILNTKIKSVGGNDATKDEVLKELKLMLPNTEISMNPNNENIIHIKNKEISQVKDYALEKVLKDVKFEGISQNYLVYLSKLCPNIQNTYLIGDPKFSNMKSIYTKFEMREGTLRESLVKCMPLDSSQHLLWETTTSLITGDTQVNFYVEFQNKTKVNLVKCVAVALD